MNLIVMRIYLGWKHLANENKVALISIEDGVGHGNCCMHGYSREQKKD